MTKREQAKRVTALKQAMVDLAAAETLVSMCRQGREDAIWAVWKGGMTQGELSSLTGLTQPQVSRVCTRVEAREVVAV
jgi:DNA-binding transcriptional regulator LsrR (DeoR family)